MTTRLLMISHAVTSATRRAAFPLDEGIEAATAVFSELPRAQRAWTAPERRAHETAQALGIAAETEPLLRDIDLGAWAGRGFEEVLAEDPEGIAAWTSDTSSAPHGGESVEELIVRIAPWFEKQNLGGGRTIAVTHPAVIRAAVVLALDVGPQAFWRIDITPLAQVDFRGDGHRWNLRGIEGRD